MHTLVVLILAVAAVTASPAVSAAATASAAEPGLAPPLSQRSPLLPGLWWDPQNSGQGFDLHVSGRTLGLVWYSFRASGEPIWYLASAEFDDDGRWQADLLRTRWVDGVAEARVVGRLEIERLHSELARLRWDLVGRTGEWLLEPFRLSAQRAEVDPSGAYHDPARDGFGLSLDQQGDGQSAIYYVYDEAGDPTWWLGYRDRADAPLQLKAYSGPCPGCSPRAVQEEGSLDARIDTEDARATLRLDAGSEQVAAAFRELSEPLKRFTPAVSERQADYRLARFDDAAALRGYLEAAILDARNWRRPPPPGVDLSPAPPPPPPISISTTNRVVDGVDEPDVLKSDGRFAYSLSERRDPPTVRIVELGEGGLDPRPRGELSLGFSAPSASGRGGLFLTEDRLVHVDTELATMPWVDLSPPPPGFLLSVKTRLAVYDRTDPVQPVLRWSAEIDGHLVESRRIDGTLYLVLRQATSIPGFRYGFVSAEDVEHNTTLLAATPLADLLPKIRFDGRSEPLFEPSAVHLPPAARIAPRPDIVSVVRIDIEDPTDRQALAVVGGVAAVHVSTGSVFLTTSRYTYESNSLLRRAPGISTDIHRIAITDSGLEVASSGSVDGLITAHPLRQPFRLSEHDGLLRIVTEGDFGAFGLNRLSVLTESTRMPGLLKTVSSLPNAQRPAPIGKPDELLFATRFAGDRLFAVTFRQIDPLYVIDLADPADPEIRGELELPGFSDYLHPFGSDLLLGVGRHVPMPIDNDTLFAGVKLSLFDIRDSSNPQVLEERIIGERGSDSAVLASHRAFAVLPLAEGRWRIGLPMRVHGDPEPAADAPADWSQRPYTHSGLYAFDLDAANPALQPLGPMIVTRGDDNAASQSDRSARALLTPSAALFWRNDRVFAAPWADLANPLGPR